MFQSKPRKSPWSYSWPAIIVIVLLLLAAVQILRVNRPAPDGPASVGPVYTPKGPFVVGKISIPGKEFYTSRINLNRRSKLTGTFRNSDLRYSISTLVIGEPHLDKFKLDQDHPFLVRTGFVPGGKVSVVLDPGAYLLLIDNRRNAQEQTIEADFHLE